MIAVTLVSSTIIFQIQTELLPPVQFLLLHDVLYVISVDENLNKKSKGVNICRFPTVPVKTCSKRKFETLNVVLALNIIKIILSGCTDFRKCS